MSGPSLLGCLSECHTGAVSRAHISVDLNSLIDVEGDLDVSVLSVNSVHITVLIDNVLALIGELILASSGGVDANSANDHQDDPHGEKHDAVAHEEAPVLNLAAADS